MLKRYCRPLFHSSRHQGLEQLFIIFIKLFLRLIVNVVLLLKSPVLSGDHHFVIPVEKSDIRMCGNSWDLIIQLIFHQT